MERTKRKCRKGLEINYKRGGRGKMANKRERKERIRKGGKLK